jgi:pantetheine-phosphate adenylyltransferase
LIKDGIYCFPGSFDPFTIGHYQAVAHLLEFYEHIHIVVANNPQKTYMFPLKLRHLLVTLAYLDNPRVSVGCAPGMLLDYLKWMTITKIVRTYRNDEDFKYENELAENYKKSNPNISVELVEYNADSISSTLVRELIQKGSPWHDYVPEPTIEIIREYLKRISRNQQNR